MSVPVRHCAVQSVHLADRAFGTCPPRSAAELPEPRGGLEMWWRAVALGGVGHYAAAHSSLVRLCECTTDPVLLSLAASTEGSLLRQLGRHAQAAHADGRAAALVLPRLRNASAEPVGAPAGPAGRGRTRSVDPGGEGYGYSPDLRDAAADALTGLAADALGTGRLALAARLLDRCSALLNRADLATPATVTTGSAMPDCASSGTAVSPGSAVSGPVAPGPVAPGPAAPDSVPSGPPGADGAVRGSGAPGTAVPGEYGAGRVDRPRARIRLNWVRAETALAAGHGAPSLAAAEAALTLAARGPSIRHRVKSQLLVAVAAGVVGNTERAADLAAQVDEQCRDLGLVPLQWACAMLRAGFADPDVRAVAVADATACRELISRRGGRFDGPAG